MDPKLSSASGRFQEARCPRAAETLVSYVLERK
jgi:hypothetical protein